jgi:hypothetical protein
MVLSVFSSIAVVEVHGHLFGDGDSELLAVLANQPLDHIRDAAVLAFRRDAVSRMTMTSKPEQLESTPGMRLRGVPR